MYICSIHIFVYIYTYVWFKSEVRWNLQPMSRLVLPFQQFQATFFSLPLSPSLGMFCRLKPNSPSVVAMLLCGWANRWVDAVAHKSKFDHSDGPSPDVGQV